jgi:hypothetical protein
MSQPLPKPTWINDHAKGVATMYVEDAKTQHKIVVVPNNRKNLVMGFGPELGKAIQQNTEDDIHL